MAGNKVNAKNKGKGSKCATSTNDENESEELDNAMLRKPIPTSITGFAQARKIFDLASEELKDLLANECDLLYECKVCRNIFRSLANFISHKRMYCREKFSSTLHSEFMKATSVAVELSNIRQIERGYQEYINTKDSLKTIVEEDEDDRIPLSKDITDIIERLTKTKGRQNNDETNQVILEKIPTSSVAVFQNFASENKQSDKMRSEVRELDHILSRDQAVLQSDGKFTIISSKENKGHGDNVIQISDDDDNEEQTLKCKICELQFSTQKTLKFHMKYKHVESRLVYPCPDCLEIFSTSWSVYRHLFKVHRKTAAQIRRLRESIQAKAFKMNNPPAFYEKRKNNMKPSVPQIMTKEERIDQENQAWMDNMECDGEVPRCGGCGRTFERRAALMAHTQTCQPRSRALLRRPESKKIEIQIRKDYNKGPTIAIMKATGIQGKGVTVNEDTIDTTNEDTIDAANEDTIDAAKNADENENNDENDEDIEDTAADDAAMDVDEEAKSDESNEDIPEDTVDDNKDKDIDVKPSFHLPYAIQTEKSNFAAFKQRIDPHIDFNAFLCKKCQTKQKSSLELFNHMADHFKWKRYACKLCNFKHYDFEKLPEHVKIVHKLKGDSDFYHSTVKAIDGHEAMLLSRCLEVSASEETNDPNEESLDSGQPSRCSSDSSRLSDDSSSSTHLKEVGSRKRKMRQNKVIVKRQKEGGTNDEENHIKNGDVSMDKVLKSIIGDTSTSSVKAFDENSSDFDDMDEKISKRLIAKDLTASRRRPVRNKTKPKNEDFEYDLSNLLKMEAQGYRDSQQIVTNKPNPPKKKTTPDPSPLTPPTDNNKLLNNKHQYFGALAILSRKAVENATAHMKTASFPIYSIPKERPPNIFARPMLPKVTKVSPRKDIGIANLNEDVTIAKNKIIRSEEVPKSEKEVICIDVAEHNNIDKDNNEQSLNNSFDATLDSKSDKLLCNESTVEQTNTTETPVSSQPPNDAKLGKDSENLNIPAVLPMTIRRHSLEMMKPIIKQNITDFTKAGMKTKILVIKPIKNKDGTRRSLNTPLKFQAIKLKEKGTSNDDQAVLVKVPKVTCTTISEVATNTNCTTVASLTKIVTTTTKETEDVENSKEVTGHIISTVPSLPNNVETNEADTDQIKTNKNHDSNLIEFDSNKSEIIENVVSEAVVANTDSTDKKIEVEQTT